MTPTQYVIWLFLLSVFFFASSGDDISDRSGEEDKYRVSIITHERRSTE